MKKKLNILLSRTDAIGDVVLSLPLAGILKKNYPDCKIFFLGQTYTREIIESCEYVDEFLDWKEIKCLSLSQQINFIKKLDLSLAIIIFPKIHLSWLFKKAGVPIRIGTSRRWYHWFFCNQKISFSRHRSNLHESQLNLNLLIPLGFKSPLTLNEIRTLYGIKPPSISDSLLELLDKDRFNLILHPKSRGNGKEWGLENFSRLIDQLDTNKFKIFLTGTQNEYHVIESEILSKHSNVVDLVGKIPLNEFVGFIAQADGLIASGTGPLHIAAAVGIHAIGLYPPIRPVFSKRWAPVGINAKAFDAKKNCVKCNKQSRCDCLRHLNPSNIVCYLENLPKIDRNIVLADNQKEIDVELNTNFPVEIDKKRNNKTFRSNESWYKKLHIMISLDKINKPNCGLGRVAIDFSKALVNQNENDVELTYIVNGNNEIEHLNNQPTKKLSFINRVFPAKYGNYEILHKLHQTPSFKINGAQKTVLTIHDLNFLYTKSKFKAKEYLKKVQKNVNEADAVVFISKFTKEVCLQNLDIPKDKILKVIYNGVVLPSVVPQKPSFINGDVYLFSIGQFLTKKNFHVLLPFIAKLQPHIKLVIAGEINTAYGAYVKKQVSELNLQSRVILPGPITESEKLYLYQNCFAFVFPSLAEGFGLPIIEAMRSGKPVFCSDKTSLKEIGDKFVYFWENFVPDEMKRVFEFGINDFNEHKKHLAYKYSQQFTWQKNAEEYIELYKSLFSSE